jgi:hypothetical protein
MWGMVWRLGLILASPVVLWCVYGLVTVGLTDTLYSLLGMAFLFGCMAVVLIPGLVFLGLVALFS